MRLTKLHAVLFASCASSCAHAAPAQLDDYAARIEYGYYTDDPRTIEVARAELARLEQDPSVGYYRALAAFRLADLALLHGGRDVDRLLGECIDRASPAQVQGAAAAEHWLLVAVCTALPRADGPLQQRRLEQALAHARQLSPHNPRIPLVEAWALSRRPALASAEVRHAAAVKLAATVAAFGEWSEPDPGWGEAEALAALGEIAMHAGEQRAARDYLERALLVAPDYRFAIDLRTQLLGGKGRK